MDTDFLARATSLFIEYGAKSLTMDDVAREFGMSKRTLYQHYPTKENLLEAVLDFKLSDIIRKMERLDIEVQDAVERMFCREQKFDEMITSNKSVMIRQLLRYYPNIFEKHITKFAESFTAVLVRNIERGREQGYYKTDFDAEFYANMFFQMVLSFDGTHVLQEKYPDRNHFNEQVMSFYLNAICNEKGRKKLNEITNNTI